MNIITRHLVIISVVTGATLSACTTVDLTQVAVNQPQATSQEAEQNVVEKASFSLTSLFHDKGWCESDPAEKTKTATNILLHGRDTDSQSKNTSMATPIGMDQLLADIAEANYQVEQTTKAAEIYLVVADDMAELDRELSQLEAALLSSREAQAGFVKSMGKLPEDSHITSEKLEGISKSIDSLKIVTDAYGDRIRAQIAARASGAGS